MEIPGTSECTVEVGCFAGTLAIVNGDAVVPIPPTPRCRVADPHSRELRTPGFMPGVFCFRGPPSGRLFGARSEGSRRGFGARQGPSLPRTMFELTICAPPARPEFGRGPHRVFGQSAKLRQ